MDLHVSSNERAKVELCRNFCGICQRNIYISCWIPYHEQYPLNSGLLVVLCQHMPQGFYTNLVSMLLKLVALESEG